MRQLSACDDAAAELADLRQQVETLRQAVRARDDFIAIAAHELRNPMTPMIGVAELALAAAQKAGEACPPRITRLLERLQLIVQEYVKRATVLLDVSRIETGNLRLAPSATNLSELVRSIAQKYEAPASRAGCSFDLDIEDGVTGVLDRLAVEQVIENLLSNALKFGMGKPVTVSLRSDGQLAELAVRDRGIGMWQGQQARIFGEFEQVVSRQRGSGFGVGLWVARRLVEAMQGRITVSARLGEGSTFSVTLPLSPSESGLDQA